MTNKYTSKQIQEYMRIAEGITEASFYLKFNDNVELKTTETHKQRFEYYVGLQREAREVPLEIRSGKFNSNLAELTRRLKEAGFLEERLGI